MKKKITITITLLIGVILLLSLWQCEKEPLDTSYHEETTNLKNSAVIKDLMNEPVIKNMLTELKDCHFSVNDEGILDFDKQKDFYKTIDILTKYDSIFVDPKGIYPYDPVFVAFEVNYGFNSLREEIDLLTTGLEVKDELTELNDPDDHHIVSDVFRTLLTPDCEMIVNDVICIYGDETTSIGIGNLDYCLRDTAIYLIETSQDLPADIANLSTQGYQIIMLDDTEDIYAQFHFTKNNASPNTIMLYNETMIIGYEDEVITYTWNFGDGDTETRNDQAPFLHTYSVDGNYTITLYVKVNGFIHRQLSHSVNISTSAAPDDYLIADFSYTDNGEGTYYFYSTSQASTGITFYEWDFGDDETSTGISTSHTYSSNGDYTVKLKIHNTNGQTKTFQQVVTVDGTPACCKAFDREVDEYIEYITDSRRLKLVLKIRNVWPVHFITSKSINYKQKQNGSWTRTRADKIKTQFGGIIYDSNCVESKTTGDWENKENREKAAITRNYWADPFRVKKGTVYSTYYVKEEGVIKEAAGLSLHDEACN